jgi:NADH:ubiquinone oxidoreductase subunit D
MPNITVTVSEGTYRRARVRAAEIDTSVSAIVAKALDEFAKGGTSVEIRRKRLEALRERTGHFSASARLSREDLYAKRPGRK